MDDSYRPQTFPQTELRRSSLGADPLVQFRRWLGEAVRAGEADPHAATLATVDPSGAPAARTVTLKGVDARGFLFTSRHDSAKARQIDADPRVGLVVYWPGQGRQVRVGGAAERVPAEESARYFRARPRPAQLALLAFPQGQPIRDRAALDRRVADLDRDYRDRALPVPAWGGYVVRPRTVEFWQGRTDRLHDRFLYRLADDGTWAITRLAP